MFLTPFFERDDSNNRFIGFVLDGHKLIGYSHTRYDSVVRKDIGVTIKLDSRTERLFAMVTFTDEEVMVINSTNGQFKVLNTLIGR